MRTGYWKFWGISYIRMSKGWLRHSNGQTTIGSYISSKRKVLWNTETTQNNIRNDDIYWRGSIGQKHSATTSQLR